MKQKLLLFTLLCCGFIYNTAKANETEPNDTKAQANTLALNGSNAGTIGSATDVDWYKVTTNGDGRIDLTLNVSNGLYAWFVLYDNDGTTQLNAQNTNGTLTYSQDGLATGTYYIKVYPYYSGQMPVYAISNTLTKPAQANDAELNDTKAQAITLPLNSTVTGHTDYYYKNHRDSADWYKLTTNSDGLIRLRLTSANNQYVWAYLYDQDGTTQLNAQNTNSTIDISTDGLAAGTYYVMVRTYYNTGFAPYTLADSLFKPAQANDNEPNDSKATAQTLGQNKKITGHTDYYFNNHRDSADWYKLTTDKDGMVQLKLTSNNGQYIWAYLFDKDGTTQLNAQNTNGTVYINTDGLAKGTYYVLVRTYYNTGFAPYTLTDSVFGYGANDKEPNKYAKQASTLPVKVTTQSHVGFYYNNQRDSTDWHKINYTGPNNGSMSITFKLLPLSNGSYSYTWIRVYKDTNASPIYNNNFVSPTNVINLSSLTQGYYYVQVFMYYNSQFQAYTLNPSFSQNKIAKIAVDKYNTIGSCDTNHISYLVSNTNSSSTVQLYRFGVAYGNAIVVAKGKTATFNNLPAGSYYATAFADGATGQAFGTSAVVTFKPPVPAGLSTTTITKSSAKLKWTLLDCANYYKVRYRKHGTATWTNKQTVGNVNSLNITGLTANTKYEWEVAATDSANGQEASSAFTDSLLFTTSASLIADNDNNEESLSINKNSLQTTLITVSPNPASSYFIIHFNLNEQNKINAAVYNANGKAAWTSGLINANALNGKQVNVNQFAKGIYYLKLMNEQGELMGSTKIIVAN